MTNMLLPFEVAGSLYKGKSMEKFQRIIICINIVTLIAFVIVTMKTNFIYAIFLCLPISTWVIGMTRDIFFPDIQFIDEE